MSDSSRLGKARMILSLCSKDMVEDIILLIQSRGAGVIDDIYAQPKRAFDPPRVLGVLSRDYIDDSEVGNLLIGLSTILLASLRKPKWGNDEYQKLLQDAFNLPNEIAAPIANNIETYDPISWGRNADGDNKLIDWTAIGRNIQEGVHRFLNWVPKLLQLNWEIDQNQNYDTDFLYELSKLGDIVIQMNRRANLMTAQALINQNAGMFQAGDPDETEDDTDMQLGDALASLARKDLPPSIMGGFASLANVGKRASVKKVEELANRAGLKPSKRAETLEATHPPKSAFLRKSWNKILGANPSIAALIGAGLGSAPGLLKLAFKGKGSPEGLDLYGEVAEEYGPQIAQAWLQGDVDGILENMLGEIDDGDQDDVTTGDPDLDNEIEQAAAGEVASMELSPELGGLLTKFKYKRAKKKFAKKKARMQRKAGKKTKRATRKANVQSMKSATQQFRQSRRDLDPEQFMAEDIGPSEDYAGQAVDETAYDPNDVIQPDFFPEYADEQQEYQDEFPDEYFNS